MDRQAQTSFDLGGRVAVITGAAQGIGRVYARHFAAAGAVPVIADRNREQGEKIAAEIEDEIGQAMFAECDVTDENAAASLVDEVTRRFGRIDILINNAAIFSTLGRGPFYEIDLADWRDVIDVNVTGSFIMAKAVAPVMRQAGWGRIINISSNVVPLGLANFTHYVTSKAAVIGMTRAMARELGKDGVTANAVLPGLTETEVAIAGREAAVIEHVRQMQCVPFTQMPEDLVGAVLFLASPASAFIAGQSIMVDGGAAHL